MKIWFDNFTVLSIHFTDYFVLAFGEWGNKRKRVNGMGFINGKGYSHRNVNK